MPIATVNPTSEVTEVEFTALTDGELEDRVRLSATTYEQWKSTTFASRARLMHEAARLMEADKDTLAHLITREMGKPIAQAETEVDKSVACLRYYADNAENHLKAQPLERPERVNASRAYSTFEPIGAVLAVMPWNYPIWQVVRFAAPTLMAGNTGLLKHASNVPQAALYLEQLFQRAGFPDGAFQSLLIPASRVDALIRRAEIAAVTITGSEPAGRQVAQAAGESIKPSVLELGGSDPFVVLPSADIDAAVKTAVKARTTNNGQACINAKRFIVHTDVFEEFQVKFVAAISKLTVGDPQDRRIDVGPLATSQGLEEIDELVQDAVSHGATVLTGGGRVAGPGWFYQPTVLTNITPAATIYLEEAFGPVASLYRVDSVDEAVALANGTRFGLGSAVWGTDDDEISSVVSRLQAGAVFVNGMTISYPELPFGGTKASGYGRELAAEGIRAFCNQKTVWVA